jgi:hypothetical protein
MGFFGMLFWLLVIWLVIRAWRRSERCVAVGPRGEWNEWYGRDRYRTRAPAGPRGRSAEKEEYIESLESRISELEERLDFTERLLASRNEK